MYLVIRKSDTEQLLHHFASGYQIDQRNVFRMEEKLENKADQLYDYNVVANDLRNPEQGGFQGCRAGGYQGGGTML